MSSKEKPRRRRRSSLGVLLGFSPYVDLDEVQAQVEKEAQELEAETEKPKEFGRGRRFSMLFQAKPVTGMKEELECLEEDDADGEGGDDAAERPVEEQIKSLTPAEAETYNGLRAYWTEDKPVKYDDYMILRFCRCSPGKEKFNLEAAQKEADRYAEWCLKATGGKPIGMINVKHVLAKKSLIPLGTRDASRNAVVYFKAANIWPKDQTPQEYIQMMVYVVNKMLENERDCTIGITMIANMADWSLKNFSLQYINAMLDILFTRLPVRIRKIVVVNVPSIFSVPWNKAIKPLVSDDVNEKILFADADEFKETFPRRKSYPSEMGGTLDFDKVADEFVKKHCAAEGIAVDAKPELLKGE